jgi:hypothetical protein
MVYSQGESKLGRRTEARSFVDAFRLDSMERFVPLSRPAQLGRNIPSKCAALLGPRLTVARTLHDSGGSDTSRFSSKRSTYNLEVVR